MERRPQGVLCVKCAKECGQHLPTCFDCYDHISQTLLLSAGKQGKTTVFLLTDTQIKEEAFLEDVDGLLNAGEVANLFGLDEKQDVLEVRPESKDSW